MPFIRYAGAETHRPNDRIKGKMFLRASNIIASSSVSSQCLMICNGPSTPDSSLEGSRTSAPSLCGLYPYVELALFINPEASICSSAPNSYMPGWMFSDYVIVCGSRGSKPAVTCSYYSVSVRTNCTFKLSHYYLRAAKHYDLNPITVFSKKQGGSAVPNGLAGMGPRQNTDQNAATSWVS